MGLILKSNHHYTLGITPKCVTKGGIHMRGLARGQHRSEELSQRWRTVFLQMTKTGTYNKMYWSRDNGSNFYYSYWHYNQQWIWLQCTCRCGSILHCLIYWKQCFIYYLGFRRKWSRQVQRNFRRNCKSSYFVVLNFFRIFVLFICGTVFYTEFSTR